MHKLDHHSLSFARNTCRPKDGLAPAPLEFFNAEKYALGVLLWGFNGFHYFQVPYIQRPYAWEEGNINRLMETLCSLVKHKRPLHPLGNISLWRPSRDDKCYTVVDGQQRLASLTILYSVLRHFLKKVT